MTKEERVKVIDVLMGRMITSNDYNIEWSDLRIDLYKRFYLHNYSNEKLIAELLRVDED